MKFVEIVLLKYSNFLSIPPSWIKPEVELFQDAALSKIACMGFSSFLASFMLVP